MKLRFCLPQLKLKNKSGGILPEVRFRKIFEFLMLFEKMTKSEKIRSIYNRGSGPGPRAVPYAPPPWLPGAKMFPRPLCIALLLWHHFQLLQKSFLGAIGAASWRPLEAKNGDFAREGYKKLIISHFAFSTPSQLDVWSILGSHGVPDGSQNREVSASLWGWQRWSAIF